jgi:hypothetical protein
VPSDRAALLPRRSDNEDRHRDAQFNLHAGPGCPLQYPFPPYEEVSVARIDWCSVSLIEGHRLVLDDTRVTTRTAGRDVCVTPALTPAIRAFLVFEASIIPTGMEPSFQVRGVRFDASSRCDANLDLRRLRSFPKLRHASVIRRPDANCN